jgi:short subunit dehydrogenase-like uncharacterized protein
MKVLLYGASGLTGRLVAARLAKKHKLILSGRDRGRLEQLSEQLGEQLGCSCELRVAQVHQEKSLAAAFEGVGLVVNCSGPSSKLGQSILEAAINAGAHYLDCTGEQSFIRNAFERYEAKARKAQVVAVSGIAFEVGFGDWLASLVADEMTRDRALTSISVSYAIDNFTPTTGTRRSILSALEQQGVAWVGDRWERASTAREFRAITFPSPFGLREGLSFPSGEIITIPRHIDTQSVSTFLSPTGDSPLMRTFTRASSIFGPLIPSLLASPLGQMLGAQVAAFHSSDTGPHRGSTRFAVLARGERSFERRQMTLLGGDIYTATADALAYCSDRILAGDVTGAGVYAPSQAFDPATTLEQLCESSPDLQLERDES